MMRPAPIVLPLLVAGTLAACRDKPVPASTLVPPDASLVSEAGQAAVPSATSERTTFVPDAGPRDGGSTDDVSRAEATYVEALKKGRKLTVAKSYEEAVAAFDAALAVRNGDARATAERGYARLLAGDKARAATDFEEASEATRDPKLLGQIWYNRGLVEADAANARVAFYLSNEYAPSDAAKKKLGEGSVCPLIVERPPAPKTGAAPTIVGADLPALFGAACRFEQEDCKESSPWTGPFTGPVVRVRETYGRGKSYFVTKGASALEGYEVGATWGGRCPGTMDFSVVATNGPLVHVHGFELGESGYAYMCFFPGKEPRPCEGDDMNAPGVSTQSCCAGGTLVERDLLIDTAKKAIVLRIERPLFGANQDSKDPRGPRVSAKLVAGGFAVSGLGCDTTILADPSADAGAAPRPADAGIDAAR